LGFRYTEDLVALINFAYLVLYLSVAEGYVAFYSLKKSERKKFIEQEKMNAALAV